MDKHEDLLDIIEFDETFFCVFRTSLQYNYRRLPGKTLSFKPDNI